MLSPKTKSRLSDFVGLAAALVVSEQFVAVHDEAVLFPLHFISSTYRRSNIFSAKIFFDEFVAFFD